LTTYTAPATPAASQPLYLDWGGDFQLTNNGSLVIAEGWDALRQAIVRALLNNPYTKTPAGQDIPPDYVYVPGYGAGLGLYVGQDMTNNELAELETLISNVVLAQASVDPSFAPSISFTSPSPHQMLIKITAKLINNQVGTVTLQVS
jgi:hypothetical protein